ITPIVAILSDFKTNWIMPRHPSTPDAIPPQRIRTRDADSTTGVGTRERSRTIVVPAPTPNNHGTGPEVSHRRAGGEDSVATNAPKLVVVAGPTAVGKTRLGIELGLRFGGEVVNADSRYFYRGMDVGVAKPDLAERRGVPHHLFDVLDPADEMSLAVYQ